MTGANSLATDTPANTAFLVAAGPEGSLVTRLWAIARATISTTCIYLFLRKASDPADFRRFIDSELYGSTTVGTTAVIPELAFTAYNEATPLRLEPGDELYVGIAVQAINGINFRIELTDF